MNRLLFAFCFLLTISSASGQVAPASVYLLYNSQNMDILDYRMAYSNNATAYYAYTLKPGGTDHFVLYTGAGVYADYLPNGTQNSRDFKLTDEIMSGVNNVSRQFFVLQQQQRGYVVSPVVAITKITKSGNYSLVSAAAYSFILDTDNVMMGREMSTAGSRSSVTLNTFGVRSCKYQYSFRRTGNTAGAETAEFDFIPGIGITSERSGRTAAEMQQNQVSLWGINGMPLDDYISKECGSAPVAGTPIAAAPTGTPAPIGPRLGDPGTGDPTTVAPAPVTGVVSAISNHQVVNCPKLADPGYHIVQPKETANSIARFYGITTAQLIKWNNLKDANKITICQELRVIAPGTQPQKALQATKGTAAATPVAAPKVTPPPVAPAVAPQYQPTQPAPSATLPDLFGTGGPAPLVYNSPQPTVAVPLAAPAAPVTTPASTVAIPGQQGQYYAVQPGEGVYVIAKKFGYTDERFRSMNNLPATGNVPLQVGQLLKVSECDNVQPQTYYTPVPITTSRTGALTQPTVPALTQPNTPAPSYQPVLSSTPTTGGQGFVPLGGATQPVVTAPEPAKTSVKRDPIGFKDYFVKDSETIKDIARKQKLDAAELGLINGRDQNEVLAPGTRIQIPIY